MKLRTLAWPTALLALASCAARADDGFSQIGAGGIAFAKSEDIAMAREDLYISPSKVRVRFAFVADRDTDAVVAFPLPDLDYAQFQGDGFLPTMQHDTLNFVGFTARVDGRTVRFQTEQKAIFEGRDVTPFVRRAGLPVNIAIGGGPAALDNLSKDGWKVLNQAGIVDAPPYKVWIVRTRFYWTQHFPARRPVVIEHDYTPISGGGYYVVDEADDQNWRKEYCADDATRAAIKAKGASPLSDSVTDYVLSTARTWKGPIGHFHMTLDKEAPGRVLSLCWDGRLRKTSPTRFEFDADRYVPARDVHMTVVKG